MHSGETDLECFRKWIEHLWSYCLIWPATESLKCCCMQKQWLLGRAAVKWIYHRLSPALSLTSLRVSPRSPRSGLSSCVLLSAISKSIHSLHHIISFFLTISLSSFIFHSPTNQRQKCLVCCSLTQLDTDLWGALLLPSSIYNYIIVITGMENSTWLSYNFTLFTLFPPHPLF